MPKARVQDSLCLSLALSLSGEEYSIAATLLLGWATVGQVVLVVYVAYAGGFDGQLM